MIDLNRMECFRIKQLLQRLSGVEDFCEDNRKENRPDLKKIHSALCNEFTKASLQTIAESISPSYTHSTVLHNLKRFKALKETNGLTYLQVYLDAKEILSKPPTEEEPTEQAEDVQQYLNIHKKYMLIIESRNAEIIVLKEHIKTIEEQLLSNSIEIL